MVLGFVGVLTFIDSSTKYMDLRMWMCLFFRECSYSCGWFGCKTSFGQIRVMHVVDSSHVENTILGLAGILSKPQNRIDSVA